MGNSTRPGYTPARFLDEGESASGQGQDGPGPDPVRAYVRTAIYDDDQGFRILMFETEQGYTPFLTNPVLIDTQESDAIELGHAKELAANQLDVLINSAYFGIENETHKQYPQ